MNYKKFAYKSLLLFLLTLGVVSCSSDDETSYDGWTPPLTSTQGAFVLNSGKMGLNNASLAYYDKATKECNPTVFESMNNGLKLGDTAEDLLIDGGKMYIAVYNSGIIYIMDKNGKVVKKVVSKKGDNTQKPRRFASDNNYVYVTYYDGYLARIDKKTLELDALQVKVGNNPESVKVTNGKIYVANSGGLNPNYDTTVSVIDTKTFVKEKDIKVIMNPTELEVDRKGNVYVISMGNYKEVKNTLQLINPDYSVNVLGYATLMKIHPNGDKLYTIYAQFGAPSIDYKIYDINTQKYLDKSFVNNNVKFVASPSTIDIDPATNNVYIGTSDYRTNAEMYIISPTDTLISSFNTGGLNPKGAFFIK